MNISQRVDCGGLFVLGDRPLDGDDHPTVSAPVHGALFGFGDLHRNGTDWTGFRRYKGLRLLLHTTYNNSK